jgi:hypothetical protein
MIAVAVVALILGVAALVRRRFFPPLPQPGTPRFPIYIRHQPDSKGGVRIWQMYTDLDEGIKGIQRPRILSLSYRIRHWGRLTWADEITERIHRPDPPENAVEPPGK